MASLEANKTLARLSLASEGENCHSLAPLFVIVRVQLTDNSIEGLRTELFSGALKNNRSLSELNLSCECMIEGHKWSNERFDFFFCLREFKRQQV